MPATGAATDYGGTTDAIVPIRGARHLSSCGSTIRVWDGIYTVASVSAFPGPLAVAVDLFSGSVLVAGCEVAALVAADACVSPLGLPVRTVA